MPVVVVVVVVVWRESFLPRGDIVRFTFAMNSSANSSEICHFMPFPGSSVRRGTFTNALFKLRL